MSSLLNNLLDGTEDLVQMGLKGYKHARNEVIGIVYLLIHCYEVI